MFVIYKNIIKSLTENQKYTILDDIYDEKSLKEYYRNSDCLITTYNNDEEKKSIVVLLFNRINIKLDILKTHINKIKFTEKKDQNIIIVTEDLMSHANLTKINNYFKLEKTKKKLKTTGYTINAVNYLYSVYILDVTTGPFVGKHTILTREEVETLCFDDMHMNGNMFPKMKMDESQCIWIGATVGDIIEIESPSSNTLTRVSYRIVV